ncbi:MAG: phosphodiester glycosidase family protein [Chthoniobacterales bacterium]
MLASFSVVWFSAAAQAEWVVHSVNSEPGHGGVEHRHLVFKNTNADDRAVVDLAIFSPKSCTLGVIDNPSGATLAELAGRETILAGVNGGYFDLDFAPIGLRINKSKKIAPLQRAPLLTGVLISTSRRVQIMRLREFPPRPKLDAAIQCGPFLVDGGNEVRGLDDSRPARRTFAATSSDHRAALGVCSDVSLAQLAEILATGTPDFRISRALNLDGGSSSAFWFARSAGGSFSIPEQKRVRDFVAIVGE